MDDYSPAKNLMTMCFTYYYIGTSPVQSLYMSSISESVEFRIMWVFYINTTWCLAAARNFTSVNKVVFHLVPPNGFLRGPRKNPLNVGADPLIFNCRLDLDD